MTIDFDDNFLFLDDSYHACGGSERLCSERKCYYHDCDMDNKSIFLRQGYTAVFATSSGVMQGHVAGGPRDVASVLSTSSTALAASQSCRTNQRAPHTGKMHHGT